MVYNLLLSSDVYCSWFSAVCATRVGRVVFPNQSPSHARRFGNSQGPLLGSCLKYNIVKLWDNLETSHHGSLPSKILRVGEQKSVTLGKRSGPCYLNLYAQSKTGRSTSRQQTGKDGTWSETGREAEKKIPCANQGMFQPNRTRRQQPAPDPALQCRDVYGPLEVWHQVPFQQLAPLCCPSRFQLPPWMVGVG